MALSCVVITASSPHATPPQVTPKISVTEAAALEAGTIGFDREIFDGTASLDGLKKKYPMVTLTPREQAFMDKEVRRDAAR